MLRVALRALLVKLTRTNFVFSGESLCGYADGRSIPTPGDMCHPRIEHTVGMTVKKPPGELGSDEYNTHMQSLSDEDYIGVKLKRASGTTRTTTRRSPPSRCGTCRPTASVTAGCSGRVGNRSQSDQTCKSSGGRRRGSVIS